MDDPPFGAVRLASWGVRAGEVEVALDRPGSGEEVSLLNFSGGDRPRRLLRLAGRHGSGSASPAPASSSARLRVRVTRAERETSRAAAFNGSGVRDRAAPPPLPPPRPEFRACPYTRPDPALTLPGAPFEAAASRGQGRVQRPTTKSTVRET